MKINSITKKKATINPRASDTSFREDKTTFTISLLFSKISYWLKSLKLMLPLNDKLSNNRTYKYMDQNYYMYKRLNKPGLLIECGFISNDNERYKLKTEEYQLKLSKIITEGIITYYS